MTLEEAQAALVLAQEELVAAQEAKTLADSTLATASSEVARTLEERNATAVLVPGTSSSVAQNVVQNGTFDDASAWSNIGMGSNETIVNSSIARVYNGVLIGSYVYNFIYQPGTFATPTRQVTFSYDMSNNNFNDGNRPQADGYRVEFRTYNAAGQVLNYYNTSNRTDTFPWTHFEATYNLADDAVRWDVGFRLVDNGYWNGNFAGSIDNVSVVTQVQVTTPDVTTYDAEKATAYNAAVVSQSQAVATQALAQNRLTTAQAEVIRLTQLVADLTPHLNAPTGLTAVIDGDNVDLTWVAPESNLSGVQVERYAIMWSTTNFTTNGWAWAHDQTSISVPLNILDSTGGLGNTFQFTIRADNDTLRVYSDRSTFASVTTVAPPWWQIQFWEGEQVSISAPEGYKFGQPRAWYGSPTDSTCGADVSSVVNELINGRTTATFSADNGVFGDPCGGVVKVLRLSTPVDQIVIVPTPTPTQEPTPSPQPTPTPTETPVIIVPEPEPTPEETVEPTPEPTIPPTEEPTPTPTPSEEPTEEPTENVVDPTPEPEPSQTPEPEPEPELPVTEEELPVTEEEAVSEIENLVEINPEELTEAQVEQLVEAALVVFETAEQGTPAYEQALEALAVAADADDPEISSELAAIPLLGESAAAVLEVFNNIGNVGADMAPQVREDAEKTVIASVIATGAAVQATMAATASAITSTSGGSSGGGGGASGGSSGGGTNRKVK